MDFARRRNRQHPYPRHGDFVGACEEALVSFAFARAGLKLGYISHEILRRWTQVLGVANFSYYVPDAPAPICGTAEIDDTLGFRVQRRSTADSGDRVIDALPDASRARPAARTWVLVRACSSRSSRSLLHLGVNNPVFDVATAIPDHPEAYDLGFRVHLDPAQFRAIPPTERRCSGPIAPGARTPTPS